MGAEHMSAAATQRQAGAGQVTGHDRLYSQKVERRADSAAVGILAKNTDYLLHPVAPNLNNLEFAIRQRLLEAENLKHNRWTDDVGIEAEAQAKQFEAYRVHAERNVAAFNMWVPLANNWLASVARLQAMQDLLGMKDVNKMVEQVSSGLGDAYSVASSYIDNVGQTKLGAPQRGADDIASASTKCADALEAARTQYLGFQTNLLKWKQKALKAEHGQTGEKLKKIQDVIDFVGKVESLAKTALVDYGLDFANILQKAKEEAKSQAMSTSISGLVLTTVFFDKIQALQDQLAALSTRMANLQDLIDDTEAEEQTREFMNALTAVTTSARHVVDVSAGQRLSYMAVGENLDDYAAGRADFAGDKYGGGKELRKAGMAPKNNKERYAPILLMATQIHEVVSAGKSLFLPATMGVDPNENEAMAMEAKELREANLANVFTAEEGMNPMPLRMPQSEIGPLLDLSDQFRRFQGNVNNVAATLSPVEEHMSKLMKLAMGQEEPKSDAKKEEETRPTTRAHHSGRLH